MISVLKSSHKALLFTFFALSISTYFYFSDSAYAQGVVAGETTISDSSALETKDNSINSEQNGEVQNGENLETITAPSGQEYKPLTEEGHWQTLYGERVQQYCSNIFKRIWYDFIKGELECPQ